MKDLHLDSGGPPGQHGGVTGWRAITRVLRSSQVVMSVAIADLTNTLLPSDCRVCGAAMVALGKVRVCDACIAQVVPQDDALCTRCGDSLGMESARFAAAMNVSECTLCRLTPPAFERAVAFGNYDHELRELLHLLKFDSRQRIADVLGDRLATAILQLQNAAAAELIVIPVPMFAPRERERGFNQSKLLADSAVKRLRRSAPAWKLTVHDGVLLRVKDTRPLFALNPAQRRRNLRGAFRVAQPGTIRGREVLLLDDIMTTGATAREGSTVLRRAGATKVWVATVAKAQPESATARYDATDTALWQPLNEPLEPDIGRRAHF